MGYNISGVCVGISLNVAAIVQNEPPIKTVTIEVQIMTRKRAAAAPLVIATEQIFDAGGCLFQGPALLRYALQCQRH